MEAVASGLGEQLGMCVNQAERCYCSADSSVDVDNLVKQRCLTQSGTLPGKGL